MIPRHEFHTALNLAAATAALPRQGAAPLDGFAKAEYNHVCFDFWPGDSLRIVGTNGQRLVIVYLTVPGLPKQGRFLMPLAEAQEALNMVSDPLGAPVSLALFGLESMIITSGDDARMVQAAQAIYPEYHLLIKSDVVAAKGALFNLDALHWVMHTAAPLADGALQLQLRANAATTVRPKLHAGYRCIRDIILAVKASGVDC